MHELILGGAKSGKSRAAESRAALWMGQTGHQALLLATATAGDPEMAARIARHQVDRLQRVPQLACLETQGPALLVALAQHSAPHRLLVVDCLTLWLTQMLMPLTGPPASAAQVQATTDELAQVLRAATGPVVLVSNEIGMGVMPLGSETRRFVDALGLLHQAVAAACSQLVLMVAGQELRIKGGQP